MASRFDEMDARAAEAIGRQMGDVVHWHPMLIRQGNQIIAGSASLDGMRAVRQDLQGIVTWAPDGVAVESGQGGASVGNATLMVDLEVAQFPDPPGFPRRGDRLYLPRERKPADRWVQVVRQGDDGSARVLLWCEIVRA